MGNEYYMTDYQNTKLVKQKKKGKIKMKSKRLIIMFLVAALIVAMNAGVLHCQAIDDEIETPTSWIAGDVNGDSQLNNSDLIKISRYIVGLESFNFAQFRKANVNGDLYVDNIDLITLSQMVVNNETFRVRLNSYGCAMNTNGIIKWRFSNSNSLYKQKWSNGVSKWDTYCSTPIFSETLTGTILGVQINEYSLNNNIYATTTLYPNNSIKSKLYFDPQKMLYITDAQREAIFCREGGKCLGLGTNTVDSYDIMYTLAPIPNATELSGNDKVSFNATWNYHGITKPSSNNTSSSMFTFSANNNELSIDNKGKSEIKGISEKPDNYDGMPIIWSCEPAYCIDVNKYEDLIGFADYVFIATINDNIDTVYWDQNEIEGEQGVIVHANPCTKYSITVLSNIKGSLRDDVELQVLGGLDISKEFYWMIDEAPLPDVGKTYIVFANGQSDGSLVASGKNSTLLYSDELYEEILAAAENPTEFDYPSTITRYDTAYETISTNRATAITANAARELTNSDLVHIARIVAELDKATPYDLEAYDSNSDGVITNYDLLNCARHYVGLE